MGGGCGGLITVSGNAFLHVSVSAREHQTICHTLTLPPIPLPHSHFFSFITMNKFQIKMQYYIIWLICIALTPVRFKSVRFACWIVLLATITLFSAILSTSTILSVSLSHPIVDSNGKYTAWVFILLYVRIRTCISYAWTVFLCEIHSTSLHPNIE